MKEQAFESSRMMILATAYIAMAMIPSAPVMAQEPVHPTAPEVSQLPDGSFAKLGEIPVNPQSVAVSADGRKLLMNGQKGSRHAVYVNGVVKALYDEILMSVGRDVPFAPCFTADGGTSLFLARRGTQYHLVADGRESNACDRILGAWVAPKGDGYTIMGLRGNRMFMHRDGVDLPNQPLDGEKRMDNYRIEVSYARYSLDGRRFVCLSNRNDPKKNTNVFRWVLDQKPLGGFSSLPSNMEKGGWVFGEGENHAFIAGDIKTERVVFNGSEGPVFSGVSEPQITADGKQVVYLAQRMVTNKELDICVPRLTGEDEKSYQWWRQRALGYLTRIFRNGVELPWVEEPLSQPVGLVVGPSGRIATAYVCRWSSLDEKRGRPNGQPSGFKVWIDGESSMDYDSWHGTRFSPDGSIVVSFVAKDQNFYALINDEELGPYSRVDPAALHFSPDGKHYMFPAQLPNHRTAMIVDGKPSAHRFDGGLVRSAGGKVTAYVSFRGKHSSSGATFGNLIVGDKVHEIPGQIVNTVLSEDGSRVACVFTPDPDAWKGIRTMVWMDGEVMPPLARQEEVSDLEFSPDGKHFAYTATVDDPDNPKRGGASGYDMHVRVIDGRPGPMFHLDYKTWGLGEDKHSTLLTRMYPTTFEEDGSVSYFARHEGALHRVSLSSAALAGMPDLKSLASRVEEDLKRNAAQAADTANQSQAAKMKEREKERSSDPFQILHEFSQFEPDSGFVIEGPDGRLYGSEVGGRFDVSQLFSIKKDGSDYKVLHSFEGEGEKGVVVNSMFFHTDGNLYGTTKQRLDRKDPDCAGTIFCHIPDKGVHNNLYVGAGREAGGAWDVIQNPMLAGIGPEGPHFGKLFAVTVGVMGHRIIGFDVLSRTPEIVFDAYPSASTIQRTGAKLLSRPPNWQEAAAWNEKNKGREEKPISLNLLRSGDKLYSVFGSGGRGDAGRVISLNLDGTDYAVIYDFAYSDPTGGKPKEWLAAGDDGLLYGVTTVGGANGNGAVFSLKPDGSECRLLSPVTEECGSVETVAPGKRGVYFGAYSGVWQAGRDGAPPRRIKDLQQVYSLSVGADGILYGATISGGEKFHGFVFSLRPPGPASSGIKRDPP